MSTRAEGQVPEVDPRILAYYERGREAVRLDSAAGPLEFERTQELILRHLPGGRSLQVLDVGGGPGAYAAWLISRGHEVRLIDPVPLHVEQAGAIDGRIDAEVGDARDLAQGDTSVDVVLLLGPLYHLIEPDDRRVALAEARRVLRPGGLLFAAAISRFAALLDLLVRLDRLHDPDLLAVVKDAVRTGVLRGYEAGAFTTAYLHRPTELLAEIEEADLIGEGIYNVEGPGFLAGDLEQRWTDPGRRHAVLEAARLVESDPDMLAAASHLLAVSRRPR